MRQLLIAGVLLLTALGCKVDPAQGTFTPRRPIIKPDVPLSNPTFIPVHGDPEVTWMQIVDIVDDYFQIENEIRPVQAGEVLTEGRIDTFARTGSTLFEPWNRDAINLYERLEGTMQSIRRRAYIAVRPASGGYLVEVVVMKELEDLDHPQNATAGAALFHYDNSVSDTRTTNLGPDPSTPPGGDTPRPFSEPVPSIGWIPLGRDNSLEQEMVAQLQKLFGVYNPSMNATPATIVTPGTAVPVQIPPPPQVQVIPQPY